jgi:tetratricopeptide (TPR) repeat protein
MEKDDYCRIPFDLSERQTTLDFISTLGYWYMEDYEPLASRFDETVSGCMDGSMWESQGIHDKLILYYEVLSYAVSYKMLPAVVEHNDCFVPSSFLAYQTNSYKEKGNARLEWINRELAFFVDQGWSRPFQRAQIGYWQGLKYLEEGKDEFAERAFLAAFQSFSDSDKERLERSISQSLALLGKARFRNNDSEGAIYAYKQSILASPKEASRGRVDAFFELIVVWLEQGHDTEYIVQQFCQLRSTDPTDPFLTSAPVDAFIEADMLDAAKMILDTELACD